MGTTTHPTFYLYSKMGNFFKTYDISGHTDSLQLVVEHGTYLAIGFTYAYSAITNDPIIALVSGHDGYGTDNRTQVIIVHDTQAFEFLVALTAKETITVTLNYRYEGIQHYRFVLFKLMV